MESNDMEMRQRKQHIAGTFMISAGIMSLKGPPIDWPYTDMLHLFGVKQAILPHLPFTKGLREDQLYDIYAEYVEKYGNQSAQAALNRGDQVIVGLRIETNTRANQGKGLYDDRLAIIWQETKNGAQHGCIPSHQQRQQIIKHGADFTANTESSAYYEQPTTHLKQIKSKKTGKMIQVKVADKIIDPNAKDVISHPKHKWDGHDVNKDGRLDLGQLVPGTYTFFMGKGLKVGSHYLRGRGQQIVARDVNHDGSFTLDDIWHTDKGDVVVESDNFGILIHKGGVAQTFSAGCQTLPPIEFSRFLRTLAKQREYYYVLVTLK